MLPIAVFTSISDGGGTAAGYLGLLLGTTSLAAVAAALVWSGVALARSERWLVRRLGAVISPKGEDLPTKMALKDMALAGGHHPSTRALRP